MEPKEKERLRLREKMLDLLVASSPNKSMQSYELDGIVTSAVQAADKLMDTVSALATKP